MPTGSPSSAYARLLQVSLRASAVKAPEYLVRCEEGVPCDSSTIGWIVMHRVCGCAAGGAAVPRYTVLSSERCTRDDTDRGVPAPLARADTTRSGRCVRRPRCRPAHIDHGRLVSAGSIADLVPATAGTVVTTPDT